MFGFGFLGLEEIGKLAFIFLGGVRVFSSWLEFARDLHRKEEISSERKGTARLFL